MSAAKQWTKRGFDDSVAALIENATQIHGRIARLAPFATPGQRTDLRIELSCVALALEKIESLVVSTAQRMIRSLPPVTPQQFVAALEITQQKAPNAPRPNARSAFVGGRGLPKKMVNARRALRRKLERREFVGGRLPVSRKPKRLTAGRAP